MTGALLRVACLSGLMIAAGAVTPHAAHAGVFRDLVKGTDDEKAAAALAVLKDPGSHARMVVRRALVAAARVPVAKHLPHTTNVLKNSSLDVATRGVAALSLGVIGRDHPQIWPPGNGDPKVHRPLPVFAKNALRNCLLAEAAKTVRRACAEAVGLARVDGALAILQPIAENQLEDPVLRIFAGRAISRITGELSVPTGGLSALMTMVQESLAQ